MAATATAQAELCRLRQDIARLEGRLAEADRLVLDPAEAVGSPAGVADGLRPRVRRGRVRFGVAALDGIVGGGLPLAALHEIRARESRDGGAAAGFVMALLARLSVAGGGRSALWINEAGARRETGGLYGPGLAALGLDPGRIIQVAARNETEALWAFEAALSCRGLGAAICEMRQVSLDLTATRRCALGRVTPASPAFSCACPARRSQARRNCGSTSRRPRPERSGASAPASAAWPGAWSWKRTGAGGPDPSQWSGMRMSDGSMDGPARPSRATETSTRILSLSLPRLRTDRLLRHRLPPLKRAGQGGASSRQASAGEPPDTPLAVVAKSKSALRVVAADRNAERCGIRVGMSLADARGAIPALVVVEMDEAADRAFLEGIADWCDRYTPLVAVDPPYGLFLDISGCAHLFAPRAAANGNPGKTEAGEKALLADCLARLARQGVEAYGAIASTKGAAWALAHHGGGGWVPPGGEAETLADLPVAALRIDAEREALLDRLGLKRIGQLFGKPRAPLAARFGSGLIRRLDQALGAEDEVLSPRRPAPRLSVERRFAEPVSDEDSLLATLGSLARTLEPALERHGIGARSLEAAFFRVDGAVSRAAVGTASPIRAADDVSLLFAERLSTLRSDWDAGFGFDVVRLAVLEAEPLQPLQVDLAGDAAGGADLNRLVDRLGARLGPGRITRLLPVDTHVPERAALARPLVSLTAAAEWIGPEDAAEIPPTRPVRLFARPEPIEVLAEVPDGPPLRFRWRRVLLHVARAEGPERIAPEWWRREDDDRSTRDYFRVEDGEGRRYWLYREGLYGPRNGEPVWYMHGLFG
jgi:protein ImuB